MGLYETVDLGTFKACLALINKTQNGKSIKKALIGGELSATLLNCTHILDVEQLKLAVFKANTSQCRKKLTTRNIFSEVLYQLSPNRQISQAFKLFGMQETDTCFVAVTMGDSREEHMKQVLDMASAECLPLDQVSTLNSLPAIKKIYKIEENELQVGTLSEAVVSRIAGKEFLT